MFCDGCITITARKLPATFLSHVPACPSQVVNGFFLAGQPVMPRSSSNGTEGQAEEDHGESSEMRHLNPKAGIQHGAESADANGGSFPPVSLPPTALAVWLPWEW